MALISWSRISILNWVFVGVGFSLSVAFLLRNLYPVLGATERKVGKVLLVLVLVLHFALAVAIKFLFFKAGSPVPGGDGKGGDAPATPDPTEPPAMMFF